RAALLGDHLHGAVCELKLSVDHQNAHAGARQQDSSRSAIADAVARSAGARYDCDFALEAEVTGYRSHVRRLRVRRHRRKSNRSTALSAGSNALAGTVHSQEATMRSRAISVLLLAATILWEVPVLGLALAGRPFQSDLNFPPRTRVLPHPPFDWVWFALLSLPLVLVVALYWRAIVNARPEMAVSSRRPFPWWGWFGLGLIAASWLCAWHEAFVPPTWRRHVFVPLWLGYILLMNGLTLRRTGWSPITDRPAWLVALFPVSGVFWWL